MDLSALKMVVFDEADELLLQDTNLVSFDSLNKYLKTQNLQPQFVLFSATYTPDIIERAQAYVGNLKIFPLKKEALKLKGVKNLKISLSEKEKMQFVADLQKELGRTMSMIFVNTKKSATAIQERLKKEFAIEAKILIGGME
jgi:superfamily II DNA/RNA helicase